MAVAEGGWWPWAGRLQDAAEAVHRALMWLASPTDGPFSTVLHLAASDVWGGPFADQLRGALRALDTALVPWVDHLIRLHTALDQASTEVKVAMAAEASGIPSAYDPVVALAPWRRWPAPSLPVPPGWAHGAGGGAGLVWVYPDRARQLNSQLRVAGEELRAGCRRLAAALAPLLIESPVEFDLVANAADEIAAEVLRRVEALEEADRRTAGTFATVGEQLGFSGSLAPPADFNQAEVRALERAPAAAGPGRQPTQATESDPVSVATGNFLHEAIDLGLPGRGLSTVFIRTYNSLRADDDGPLGFGWSHTFGVHLRSEDGAVVVCSGDGREERHARMGTGALTAPAGATGRLFVEGDGFVLRSEDDASSRFDSSGRLLGLVGRSGNETVLAYHDGQLVGVSGAAGRVVSFEHDRAGRITALVDCLGSRFEYRYDHRGDLVEMTDPCGAGWSYDYDDDHRLIGITDPEGRLVVRNAYDDGGRVVEQHDGAGNPWIYAHLPGRTTVTDPLEQATSYEHDAEFRTTAVIDPLGAVTRFAWDKSDRLVAVVDPAGGRVTLTYDDRGHLVEAAGPGTAPVAFEWDADDNLTAVVSAEGDRASFAYDEAGRPVRLSSPAGVETRVGWRPDGLPGSVTEGDGGMTCFAYDGAGHLATSTDPLGAVTTVVCDPAGRPVSEVHPSGARTEFGWDAMGRLVSVTEAHGATTTFDYDRSGRLVALTDAVGRTTRYAYEERGLLASVTDPLERETTFTYDACGRLASRADPGGATVSFSYDPAGRLVGIEAPEVAPVSWTWDRCGRLVSVTDGTGVTTFEYDEAGRPVTERHVPSGIELLHAYDALGRRRRIELHRGGAAVAAWRHDYDADGRIIRVLDPAGQEASLAYDPAGRLREVRHANGVTSRWKYDVAGQPTTLVLRRPTGEVLGQWALAYDADGNRIRARRSWDGGTTDISYGYDALGRLTRVDDGAGVQNVVWDAVGNRLAVNGDTPATFDAADQVRSDAVAAYQHDEAGNLVAQTPRNGGPGLSLGYDVLGRPVMLSAAEDTVSFAYDGLGRRVIRTDHSGTTRRVYDGASVIAELADDEVLSLETTAGLLVLARSGPSGTCHFHPDAGTNVAEVTDNGGRLLARYAYAPFGERTTLEGAPEAAGPLGFCGVVGGRGEVGGLLDMRARLYYPGLGRFSSPDPWPPYLPEPVTLNRYLYALGDPVSQIDPFGLFCWTGKSHGKCRGLTDVVERGREVLREAAPILSTVATVTSAVAVVAAGVSVVCPPCAVAGIPIATAAKSIGTAASVVSWAALGSTCAGAGVNFDCAAGVASRSLLGPVKRFIDIGIARSAVPEAERVLYARFGKGIAGLLLKGTTSAGKTGRPGK